MRSLYEINSEFIDLYQYAENYAEENGGELPADIEARLEAIGLERDKKIEGYIRFIKSLDSYLDQISAEQKKLVARKKPIDNLIERLKLNLKVVLNENEKFKCGAGSISWRESTKTIVDEGQEIPEQYLRIKYEPNLEEIKKALQNEIELDFARLEKRNNLTIK